jgi:hypothetical protein
MLIRNEKSFFWMSRLIEMLLCTLGKDFVLHQVLPASRLNLRRKYCFLVGLEFGADKKDHSLLSIPLPWMYMFQVLNSLRKNIFFKCAFWKNKQLCWKKTYLKNPRQSPCLFFRSKQPKQKKSFCLKKNLKMNFQISEKAGFSRNQAN